MSKILVTKPYLPPREEYFDKVRQIFSNCYLTNQGPLLQELEKTLSNFLNVNHFHYVTNGTIALQIALESLGITEGEIITTPFSYVATTSSILWQRCKPVFVDIEPNNFTINVNKIEEAITPKTKAIMPVHVFGYACDVDKIETIAKKYNLKVIYDAAHAFAANYKGKALCDYGDISTLSFHATKLFHTGEGGACIVKDKAISDKLELIKKFGHEGDAHFCLGINAKQSEFHAAMGLAIFPHLSQIIAQRKTISELYDSYLAAHLQRPARQEGLVYNYAYYPVLFETENQLFKVFNALHQKDIYPRRYFYPSLNTLPYVEKRACPIAEDIATRIACLPLYPDLDLNQVEQISIIVKENL